MENQNGYTLSKSHFCNLTIDATHDSVTLASNIFFQAPIDLLQNFHLVQIDRLSARGIINIWKKCVKVCFSNFKISQGPYGEYGEYGHGDSKKVVLQVSYFHMLNQPTKFVGFSY